MEVVKVVVWAMVIGIVGVWWAIWREWWWVLMLKLKAYGKRLPPGCMGWPLLGETLRFLLAHLAASDVQESVPFFDQRQARYGPLFRSHLFGEPMIVSTSPAINYFVLQKEGLLFKSWYPPHVVSLVGKSAVMATAGQLHAIVRRHLLHVTGSASVPKYLPSIQNNVRARLCAWEQASTIQLYKEACSMSLETIVERFIGLNAKDTKVQEMIKNFYHLMPALSAFPINIPWTDFYNGKKAKAKISEILESIIETKDKSQVDLVECLPRDMLDAFMEEEKVNKDFTRSTTLDVMIASMFASFESSARTITLIVMLLKKHPKVLEKLMAEHLAIKERENLEKGNLTWEDYKSMLFTKDVINETLRFLNAAPFLCREALKDVEIAGFVIPKGWKVLPSLINAHMDANIYKDPFKFNPFRWKDDLSTSNRTFMPFGGGPRSCPGNELALLQISIFLHYFLADYEWTEMREEKIFRSGIRFKYGYPITLQRRRYL